MYWRMIISNAMLWIVPILVAIIMNYVKNYIHVVVTGLLYHSVYSNYSSFSYSSVRMVWLALSWSTVPLTDPL